MASFGLRLVAILLCGAGSLFTLDGLRSQAGSEARAMSGQYEQIPASVEFHRTERDPRTGCTAFLVSLDQAGVVDVDVCDIQGRRLGTLARHALLRGGEHRLLWQPEPDVQSTPGLYLLRLRAHDRAWQQMLVRVH